MVYHVMKSGEIRTDLTGYVVKMKDVPGLYTVIHNIKKKPKKERKVKAL